MSLLGLYIRLYAHGVLNIGNIVYTCTIHVNYCEILKMRYINFYMRAC